MPEFNGWHQPTIKEVLQGLGRYDAVMYDDFLKLKAQIYLSLEGEAPL